MMKTSLRLGFLLALLPLLLGASGIREVVLIETASSQYRFEVEIADDVKERAEGLMHREELADNAGMLFIYAKPQPVDFWMKNTPLSLDIVYVRVDGTIARIAERTTPMSEELIPSGEPIKAVLEVKAGTMRALGVAVGDRLRNPTYFP